MAINTIIFDFDGTLVNTNQVVINSWQHTYRAVEGKEHPEEEIVKTFGEPLQVSMEKAFPNHNVEEMIDIYRGYQINHFTDMIELFPGMEQLIHQLKEKGYGVAIVTSRTRESTMSGLEKFKLTPLIDCIVSCDDTDKHKPHPEPALMALRQMGVTADQALMIGDSMFDIKCAHGAGMKAVLVGWALAVSEAEKSGADRPEYIIEKAEDLFALC